MSQPTDCAYCGSHLCTDVRASKRMWSCGTLYCKESQTWECSLSCAWRCAVVAMDLREKLTAVKSLLIGIEAAAACEERVDFSSELRGVIELINREANE